MNTWGARLPGDEVLFFFGYEEVSKIRGAFENALTVRHLSPSSSLFHGLLDNNVLALRGSSVYFNCYSIQKKTPTLQQNLNAVLHNTWNSIKLRNLNVTLACVAVIYRPFNLLLTFSPAVTNGNWAFESRLQQRIKLNLLWHI